MSETDRKTYEARRVAGAFHIANALIINWKENDRGFRQNADQIAIQSVKMADSILACLEATKDGEYPQHWQFY